MSDATQEWKDPMQMVVAEYEARLDAARARILELEAQLAESRRLLAECGEWEDVQEYHSGHKYGGMKIKGKCLTVWDDEREIVKTLPADWRLQHKRSGATSGGQE